ncbi:MAG TPA: DJ-1/PfpI family protein [Gemmatimonadaceae bacterium]|nr:DJ-1/PfpI family protein [Gemmatimonadaceae bacterium]
MCAPVNRRSFVASMAALIPAALLRPPVVMAAAQYPKPRVSSTTPGAAPGSYVCPPCGLPCDKLTFDKPGSCPQCGMTLISATGAGVPTVAMLLYPGVEIIDIAGPWEAFGTAGFLVHTVAEKPDPLTLVFNQKVIPDFTFENAPRADVLLVPGGGYEQAMANPRLIAWLQSKSENVSYVMSVCTGAFILGKAGLLAGQTATATYGMVDDLLDFPNVKVVHDQRFVDNGKVITTGGLTSGIDGALHVISRIAGLGAAQSSALEMEYDWNPTSQFVRSTLADRFLPDGLVFGKGKIQGMKATLVSTEGTTDRWQAKLLVSEPRTDNEIIDILRKRIDATAKKDLQSMEGGPLAHPRPVSFLRGKREAGSGKREAKNSRRLLWTFADEQGYPWRGVAVVERDRSMRDQFQVMLSVGRTDRSAHV